MSKSNSLKDFGRKHTDSPNVSSGLWGMKTSTKAAEENPPSISPISASEDGPSKYVYLSPVLYELDEESPPELELLPEKTAEVSIKEFHQMAAEADIELRRRLIRDKDDMDAQQHDTLLEEHLRTMELRCKAIVDQWKDARKAEKQRRAAEEKKKQAEEERQKKLEAEKQKKQAEAEKQKKLAETKKQQTGKGKRAGGGKTDPPVTPVKSPEPPTKKGQTKPVSVPKSRNMKVTVEDIEEDPEQSDAASFGLTGKDSLETDSEDVWSKAPRPAKTPTSNFLAGMWGKSPSSRSSSPAPGMKRAEEKKPAEPVITKSLFAERVPDAQNPSSPSWSGMFARTTSSSGAGQGQSLWEAKFNSSPDDDFDEGPSLWSSAIRPSTNADTSTSAADSGWNFAMNAIVGERSSTPARGPQQPAYDFSAGNKGAHRTWTPSGADVPYRAQSRGSAANGSIPSTTDPRFTTWMPGRAAPAANPEADNPLKKMADLALQNLYDVASPEEETEPTDILNAMSMYTKAVTSSSGRRNLKGQNGRR